MQPTAVRGNKVALFSIFDTIRGFLKRFGANKLAIVGSLIVLSLVLVAVFAPIIAPQDPLALNLRHRLEGPSARFWLGTDEFGRDILSRIIYGSRVSLLVGVVAVTIGLFVGGSLGCIAGYFPKTDNLIMRCVDVLLAFPSILLAIGVVSILGPGLTNLMIAVGIRAIPVYARLFRGMVLQVRELEFTTATRALGASEARILFRTVLPNVIAPGLVFSSLEIAKAILLGSILSFVGLGPEPPAPEWGKMVADARGVLREAPHVALFPGFAILFAVLGFNFVGEGLRNTLDPRWRE